MIYSNADIVQEISLSRTSSIISSYGLRASMLRQLLEQNIKLQAIIEKQREALQTFRTLFTCTEIVLGKDMCRQFKNVAKEALALTEEKEKKE